MITIYMCVHVYYIEYVSVNIYDYAASTSNLRAIIVFILKWGAKKVAHLR